MGERSIRARANVPSPHSTAGGEKEDDLVTVVVPARNEEAFIGACLESILAQDYRPLQVIVVDGSSTDRTADIVRGYAAADPRIELLHNPDAIIPTSLNLALAAARGMWFVRVDAHATIPPRYVRQAVMRLREGGWGGVGGRKDAVAVTPTGRAIAMAMGSRFGVGNSLYHYGTSPRPTDHVPFGAYPTELARALGGWDERLVTNQDFEFDYRLRSGGHRLLFDPALSIAWHCRETLPDLFRQYRRYGRGKAAVAALHPRSLAPRHLAAPALVTLLATAAARGRRDPRWGLAVAPYLLALAAASAVTGRRLGERGATARVSGAFVAMHVGWGLGFIEGVLRSLARSMGGKGRSRS